MNVTVTKSEAVSEEEGHVSSRPSGARLAPSLPLLISKVPVTSKNLAVHPHTQKHKIRPPCSTEPCGRPPKVSRALQTPKKSFQTKSQIYTFRKHIS